MKNIVNTSKAPAAIGPYVQAVRTEGLLFTSGQLGIDPDLADFATVNALYQKAFGETFPARSCVQVAALPAGGLVEIEVIAAVK